MLLLMVFGDLALDFLHHLDFTLEELGQRADSIVTCFHSLSIFQRLLRLLDLAKQPSCDLLFGPWDDKIKELLVADHGVIVIRHQVHQEGALLVINITLERLRLEVACEEDEE